MLKICQASSRVSLSYVSVFGQSTTELRPLSADKLTENNTLTGPAQGNICPRLRPLIAQENGIDARHRGQRNQRLRGLGKFLYLI